MAAEDNDPVPGDMERSGEGVDESDDAKREVLGGPHKGGAVEDSGAAADAPDAPHSGTPVVNPEGEAREDPRLSAGEVAEDEVEPSEEQGNLQRGYRDREE